MSVLELKERLIDSRKFDKESDYQIIEEIYDFINNKSLDDQFIEAMFYGLHDDTEDLEVTHSLIDIIFSISSKDNISKRLSLLILSNLSTCFPHARYFLKNIIGIVASQKNIDSFLEEVPFCKEKEVLKGVLNELDEDKNFNLRWVFRKNLTSLIFQLNK